MEPGTRLGPYVIGAKLGEGGMGVVYRATDARLGRDVAIKILSQLESDVPDAIRRFKREARAIAALNHPAICQIHDVVGVEDDHVEARPRYLVLEYVDGKPVSGPLPVRQALDLGLQIASALDAAHRQGILHRDLKPANVLMTSSGAAKLLDFGIAKFVERGSDFLSNETTVTGEGLIPGSAPYMSPEQIKGEPLDSRSDIFSFGALLHEMLTGQRAFPGGTALQAMAAVLTGAPEPLPTTVAVADVVRRCLAKDPADRFQSVAALIDALQNAHDGNTDRRPSLAILPFESLGGDKDDEYFGDGLAEEIINTLARVPGLKVIARTSAFAFKGKHEDIRRIASALGVAYVLEGSVRRSSGRIRVTAQLIAAADGAHAWSERFDRAMSDVFSLQDEIASTIVKVLEVTLVGSAPVKARYEPDLAVYEHYLRGLHESQRWTPESGARAQLHFERAVALDPRFALPHAEFGHLFLIQGLTGILSPRDGFLLARRHAQQAVAIDPSLPEGHAVLGSVAALFDYDWSGAESHFTRAFSPGTVSSRVHHYYAHYYLLPTGRLQEALYHHNISIGADPLNTAVQLARTVALRGAGQHDEATAELHRMLESDPSFWFPWFSLGVHHLLEGRVEDATREAAQAFRLAPWFKPIVGLQAAVYRRTGQEGRAAELLHDLESTAPGFDPIGPAIFHLLEGNLDEVADWVARAIEMRQAAVFFFLVEHAPAIRSTTRWHSLARQLNLPSE